MPDTAERRPSAGRPIPVRRLDADMRTAPLPRWIVDGDPVFSHFLATLSAVFPRGEEFFVKTVREHRAVAAGDPILRAQVKAFAGQEAMHGRQHRALNEQLAAMGYRTARADRVIGRILAGLLRLRPRTLPLAVTAGSEHLTGILAEAVLGHAGTRETVFADPTVQTLLAWHALEELEHKNVAFDVLERSGARYPVRAAGFVLAVGLLGGYVLAEWTRACLEDRRSIGPEELRRFDTNRRRQRLLSNWSARQVVRYLRPGFHPDDMDTEALVEEWRERLSDRTTVTAGAL